MTEISTFIILLIFCLGAGVGVAVAWWFFRERSTAQASIQADVQSQVQAQLSDTFKALASDTLHQNSAAFLQLAETKLKEREQAANSTLDKKTVAIDAMIKPVSDTLQKMDKQIQALEVKREGAYRELAEMVTASRETQTQLRQETSQLLQALRAPTGRGRWGELQLQRILEMTGMSEHTQDFTTQTTFAGEDNNIRPDAIVALPGKRCVIIDSKVPLTAYLDFVQTNDDTNRVDALKQHAKHLKDHIKTLSNKTYWKKVENTPAFVVLFLPGEHFLSAALDGDNSLMEYSAKNHIVLATPMTLIALLRTVELGWRQEALQENARNIADLGGKLLGSMNIFTKHFGQMGKSLSSSVENFNKMVGSFNSNALVKARKLAEYGAGSGEKELEPIAPIEKEPRLMVVSDEEMPEEAIKITKTNNK